jgi:hypothetical protein
VNVLNSKMIDFNDGPTYRTVFVFCSLVTSRRWGTGKIGLIVTADILDRFLINFGLKKVICVTTICYREQEDYA